MNLKNQFRKQDLLKKFDIFRDKMSLAESRGRTFLQVSFKRALGAGKAMRVVLEGKIGKKQVLIGLTAVALVGAVGIAATTLAQPHAYELAIDGKSAGYLADPDQLTSALDRLKSTTEETTGISELIIPEEKLVCTESDLSVKKADCMTEEELDKALLTADLVSAKGYAILIDGEQIAVNASKEDAEAVLAAVVGKYQSAKGKLVSVEYKEDVTITQAAVKLNQIMSVSDSTNLILTGDAQPKEYTVKKGDTLWDIALINHMKPSELQAMNPGFNPAKIKVGQKMSLVAVEPYVTVVTKENIVTTEKVNFETKYEDTKSLYAGEIKVKTAGVYGIKETTQEVVKENGKVVSTTDLATKEVSKPQIQIALKGTKAAPKAAEANYAGSGILGNPVPIHVSSAFGSRGGRRHTGVDLRNPKGTPIVAADSGVVTFAKRDGTYGNLVKVSHGNGVETWYSHCDTINAKPGDQVTKGEQIATVGNTGRATGYHLHFEVRKNGTPQNPMNYL